ncbi:hypothetical protein [Winogradskyella aurantiaca]|uniref:hypothetical protein n=1 Tax=Winogradskyella aurantiaca TaxID=2219558 RepID=UPI001E37B92C|nr:hypothetical protein [Winogradskyella aurantiaca]
MLFHEVQSGASGSAKFQKGLKRFTALILELSSRDLPAHIVKHINTQIAAVNELKGTEKKDCRTLYKHQQSILKLLEKELKLVPKGYYQSLWMVLGMSAFGLPMGVAFGAAMGNMGMLGLGLPIGMSVGLAVGAGLDNKAAREGRQLLFKNSL